MHAKKVNTKIPEGWALDSSGKPTTDPDQALKGSMLPIGEAKGSALALMVEILAATFSGGRPPIRLKPKKRARGPMSFISRICSTSKGSTIDAVGNGRYRVCNKQSRCAEVVGLWQAYEALRMQEQLIS